MGKRSDHESLEKDCENIEGNVESRKPTHLIILDSLFYNFCKYKNNSSYKKQCQYFDKLKNGQTPYRLESKREIDYPLKFLNFDPEGSFTFYEFIRE